MRSGRKPRKQEAADSESRQQLTSPVECAAGTRVPLTGIYFLQHTCSRPAEEVVAVRGRRFDTCAECKAGGTYLLKRAAPLINEDPDF